MEKRHNYVRKVSRHSPFCTLAQRTGLSDVEVAETAVQFFITNDKVNVTGLVLAGSADFKTELSQSDMFDPVRPDLSTLGQGGE